MKKINTLLIILIYIGFISSCGKKEKDNNYGVSISAPKMIGTSAEVFSEDNISILKKSNSLNFLLLNKSFYNYDSIDNIAFSCLGLLESFYKIEDENYLKFLNETFEIKDTSFLFENINTIKKLIHEIDSTIRIESCIEKRTKNDISINQNISFPLLYEGMLKHKKEKFNIANNRSVALEYITIKGEIGVLINKDYSVIDIPIGNNNYSLLIVEPMNIEIKDFIKKFSEEDYKYIIENIAPQIINISFPNISHNFNFSLSDIAFNESLNAKSILINSEIKIIKPTFADIQVRKAGIDEDIKISSTTERIIIDNPFLFLIRGKISNSILTTGIFTGKK